MIECAGCVHLAAEKALLARVPAITPPLHGPKKHTTEGPPCALLKPYPMDWDDAHAFTLEHDLTIPLVEAIYDANGDLLQDSAAIILRVLREQEAAKAVEPNANSKKAARKSVKAQTCGICEKLATKTRSLKECR